ncbi:ABC transporter permease [Halodesulfurarchaeum formicicum]|uniref:ABC transporter permease n=1 Tax=Halodesulfurarchaeum formicicum TaxID=1873524 RepID=A0A1D8S7B3_9EURY|nr:iron ABC transporter permease [Halodesulfurarchaeum formicicum]AOW81228.1 ABC transporter permease [Halodesulfurarchaeum formicicum]
MKPKRGGDRIARLQYWTGEYALQGTAALTALVLVVLFYYPVGTVLANGLFGSVEGTNPVLAVLGSEFYLGAASGLTDPSAVPGGVLDWMRAGFPAVDFGLIGFTVYQALLSTLASLALGLPGAYLLAQYDFPGRETVRSLTMLPFVLPSIMVAIGFVAMFGDQGVLNGFLGWVGLESVSVMYTLQLVVLAHAFYNAPLVTRIVGAAWAGLDRSKIETARGLGAGPIRAFLDVTLPQLGPAILAGALLTFLFTFMSFPIVLALGGLELATVEVWLYARVQQLELAQAAGLAVVETVITLSLTYAALRYESGQRGLGRGPNRKPLFGSLRDPRRLGLLGYGLVVGVVFLGPILSMVVESLTGPGGPTLEHYAFLLERQATGASYQVKPLPAIRNSLMFGLAALGIAVPMGVTVAVLEDSRIPGSRLLGTLLMAPLAVSGIVLGLGLLQGLVFGTELFGHRITVTGPVAIVAAHAVAAYPFVTRTVSPMLQQVDHRLVETARVLGASRGRARFDVELPLVLPGIVAGAALAYAISVGEFDSTIILAEGSSSYTMPVAVERYLGNRTLGPATAMGTVLLGVTAISFVVIDRVGGWWEP